MKWPLTFYVDEIEGWAAGRANGPVIRIEKKYKDDRGLYEHEFKHVKQWLCLPIVHNILYNFSKKYRYWAELKAYKVQLEDVPSTRYNRTVELFADYICTRYKLKLDKKDVINDLYVI